MSPNVPALWEDDIEAYLINSNGFWACELLPNEPATVSFAHWEDKEWLVNQLLETPNYATRAEAEAQADSDTWLGLAVKSSLFLRPPQEWTRIKDFGDITAHEWVHHVQLSLEGYLPADLPCWWDEGHATYLGAAVDAVGITKLQTFERFKRARKLLVYGWSTDEAGSRSAKDWRQWLEGQEPGEALWTFCEDDLDVYAAGLLASEYLIGQYGLDAVTRIHGEFKYSVDWETRVSTVYGKSPDALNREIAEYLRSFASIFP
jgi:hypothetical protein